MYWPVWIAIMNQKSSKAMVPYPSKMIDLAITMKSTSTAQSTMHFPHYL